MGFKCAPQIMGLVREMPGPGKKNNKHRHRASGEKISKEAGKERASKSATLDRSLSVYNEYDGFDLGADCWQSICDEAEEYRVKGKTKDGKDFERKLSKTAVIGWSVTIKPPCEVCAGWTEDEYEQFDKDAWECMCEICPDLFRDENLRMQAKHQDEGIIRLKNPHRHRIGISKSPDGKFCGNLIDPSLYVRVNEMFPQMMRERGWDMDDLDKTDWEKYAEDDDYKAERDEHRKSYGRRVNEYIAQTNADKSTALVEAQDKLSEKQAEIDAKYEQAEADIEEYKGKAKRYINKQVKAKDAEIQAEKKNALKQVKERVLVDYQYSRDLHDEAVEKVIQASDRINSMSDKEYDAEYKAYIKANKPDLWREIEQSRLDYEKSLKEAIEVPEMPETMTELAEETAQTAEHLKQVQTEYQADQQKIQELKNEQKLIKKAPQPVSEATIKADIEELESKMRAPAKSKQRSL